MRADEQTSPRCAVDAARRSGAATGESGCERCATGVDRGSDAEERAGHQRADGGGEEDAPVDSDVVGARKLAGHEHEHQARSESGDGDAADRTERSEKHVLDDQLPPESR